MAISHRVRTLCSSDQVVGFNDAGRIRADLAGLIYWSSTTCLALVRDGEFSEIELANLDDALLHAEEQWHPKARSIELRRLLEIVVSTWPVRRVR